MYILYIMYVYTAEGRGPTLQSSRSLDALSDLKVQRLEAELEGARHEAQGACQREEGLKAELQRLQEEIRQLQENQVQEDSGHSITMLSCIHYINSSVLNSLFALILTSPPVRETTSTMLCKTSITM